MVVQGDAVEQVLRRNVGGMVRSRCIGTRDGRE